MILVSLVWTPSPWFSAFQHAAPRPGAAECRILKLNTSAGIIVIGEIKEEGILDAQLQCLVATNQVPYALPCLVNEDDGNFWTEKQGWEGVSGWLWLWLSGEQGSCLSPSFLYLALSGQTAWLGTSLWGGPSITDKPWAHPHVLRWTSGRRRPWGRVKTNTESRSCILGRLLSS